MTELEKLEDELLEVYGLTMDTKRIAGQDGVIVLETGKEPYISVDRHLERRRKTAVAYHEAGHLRYGLTRWARRDERKAERWTFNKLITVEGLIKGIKQCPRTLYELADYMGIDEELLRRHLLYKAQGWVYEEHGDYVISYCPVILYNWKTGQMWPEE
jgi:hypothetical protein